MEKSTGKHYKNSKGTLVRYEGMRDGQEYVTVIETGNRVAIPKGYRLDEVQDEHVAAEHEMIKQMTGRTRKDGGERKPKLGPKIDIYLMQGKFTAKEIAAKITGEPEAQGKNVLANVHARLITHQRKGNRIDRTDDGRIKVTVQ